jgi:hypothetical protein
MHPLLAWAQGLYFVATGLWPIVSPRSFQKVTGPKREMWLVKTVGVLVTTVGVVILGGRRRPSPEVRRLGALTALGLGGIDTIYAARGTIGPIYLADAVLEALFALGWMRRDTPD